MGFLNKSPLSLNLEKGHEEMIYNVVYKCLLSSAFRTQRKGTVNLLHSSWWSQARFGLWYAFIWAEKTEMSCSFFFNANEYFQYSTLFFFSQIWEKNQLYNAKVSLKLLKIFVLMIK